MKSRRSSLHSTVEPLAWPKNKYETKSSSCGQVVQFVRLVNQVIDAVVQTKARESDLCVFECGQYCMCVSLAPMSVHV